MKAESSKMHFSAKRDVNTSKNSRLFEIAIVLLRFDHIASHIVNANHGIM